MKPLDLLAKLGIVRYGATAATYRTGKDRPTELMMDGVYNANRDVTTFGKRGVAAETKEPAKRTNRRH